jgi:tetratricopeptide (TPR) repeat protein
MTSWTPTRSSGRIALVILLGGGLAFAGQGEQRDRELFQQAQKAYGVGHFDEALALYTQAYEIKPLPGFLFNIAQCHRQLGHFERAIFFYRRFLTQSAHRPVNADEVERFIADMENKLQAQQARDAEQARADAARAEAEAAAKKTAELTAEEQAREQAVRQRELEAALVPNPANARPPEPPGQPLYKKWWVWVGAGVVVAAAGSAAWVASLPHPRETTLGQINAP